MTVWNKPLTNKTSWTKPSDVKSVWSKSSKSKDGWNKSATTPQTVETGFLIQENGKKLLQENGYDILYERLSAFRKVANLIKTIWQKI
jgi:hypothetical protein